MTTKPNKPENVTRHEHLWASPAHEEAEAGRLDVCELADGEVVVWDVDPDHLMRAGNVEPGARWTWDEAMAEAKEYADSRADLARDRWVRVRVMCDFSADPLWAREGCMAEIEDLPIDIAIRDRLRAWAATYERHDGFMPELGEPPVDLAALSAFSAEGLAIARSVKAALPDWTVVYHDEAKSHAVRDFEDRNPIEHEVTAG